MTSTISKLLLVAFLQLFLTLQVVAQTSNGLIAHYKFNNDFADNSSFGNNGRMVGGTSFVEDRYGNKCSALGLNGKSFVQIPASTSLNSPSSQITITAWSKADFGGINTPDLMWFSICSKGNNPTEVTNMPQYRLQLTSVTLSLNTEFTENLTQYIAPGTWYHCAMVYTGSNVILYINGNKVFSYSYSGILKPNNQPLEIGRDVPGSEEFHYGAIDEVRIYKKALNANEISKIYNESSEKGGTGVFCGGIPPKPKPPVVITKRDTVLNKKTVYLDDIDTVYIDKVVYKDKAIYVDRIDTVYKNKTIYKDKPIYVDKIDTVYNKKIIYKNKLDTVYKHKTITVYTADTVYKYKKLDLSKGHFTLENVYFEQSKPNLLPSSKPELNELAEVLEAYPKVHIRLEGHTDNTGDPNKNRSLSEKRVNVVRNYLINKGISEYRITIKGFGESKPLNNNSTEALKKLNRRVEVKVTKR